MMRRTLTFALFLVALVPVSNAFAQATRPIQIALWKPAQIVNEERSIKGFRLNILYGVNQHVSGVDIGFVNVVERQFRGFQLGVAGFVDEDARGWQANLLNVDNKNMQGLHTGIYNQAQTFRGLGLGVINITDNLRGAQIGLVNITNYAHGLQIGLVNIIRTKEKLRFFPIVNWSF
jgi:hypothetical protein